MSNNVISKIKLPDGTSYDLKDNGAVRDVQVNGTSIVDNGTANIPLASESIPGTVYVNSALGIGLLSGKVLMIATATDAAIKSGTFVFAPITTSNQHLAAFYGLAKAAGADEKDSQLAAGVYSDTAKTAIRTMIGAAAFSDIPDTTIYATKADTVLTSTLSLGRKASTTVGTESIVLGSNAEASARGAFATGMQTVASGAYSHAEGILSTAANGGAHAEGYGSYARGLYCSHSEGFFTNAIGGTSHSEGMYTLATAEATHSQGYGTGALADYSYSSGIGFVGAISLTGAANSTTYTYSYSNNQNFTIPIGAVIMVPLERYYASITNVNTTNNTITVASSLTIALNNKKVYIINNYTSAIGSHTEGIGSIAASQYQHIQGKYNIEDSNNTYADIVGNGTETNRSNAFALDWSGNGYYNGDVYVNCNADSTSGTKLISASDYASTTTPGIVQVGARLAVESNKLIVRLASADQIKVGTTNDTVLTPRRSSQTVFYGLAKAAGDTTQSQSDNTVGTYTNEAKAAICTMLGVEGTIDYATDLDTQALINSWEVSA